MAADNGCTSSAPLLSPIVIVSASCRSNVIRHSVATSLVRAQRLSGLIYSSTHLLITNPHEGSQSCIFIQPMLSEMHTSRPTHNISKGAVQRETPQPGAINAASEAMFLY
jgi:hypothetical protein